MKYIATLLFFLSFTVLPSSIIANTLEEEIDKQIIEFKTIPQGQASELIHIFLYACPGISKAYNKYIMSVSVDENIPEDDEKIGKKYLFGSSINVFFVLGDQPFLKDNPSLGGFFLNHGTMLSFDLSTKDKIVEFKSSIMPWFCGLRDIEYDNESVPITNARFLYRYPFEKGFDGKVRPMYAEVVY